VPSLSTLNFIRTVPFFNAGILADSGIREYQLSLIFANDFLRYGFKSAPLVLLTTSIGPYEFCDDAFPVAALSALGVTGPGAARWPNDWHPQRKIVIITEIERHLMNSE
jgi:hypothetical protein